MARARLRQERDQLVSHRNATLRIDGLHPRVSRTKRRAREWLLRLPAAIPVNDGAFDAVFREVARVVRPGGDSVGDVFCRQRRA